MSDHPECPPDHPRFRAEELYRFLVWTSHGPEWHIIADMGPSALDRQDCANAGIVTWLDEAGMWGSTANNLCRERTVNALRMAAKWREWRDQ